METPNPSAAHGAGSEAGTPVGTWTYRSFSSNPDLAAAFNTLEFGRANLRIDPAPAGTLTGLLYGPGWQLTLKGTITPGHPVEVRFQGTGVINGADWIYDYRGSTSCLPGPTVFIKCRPSSVRSCVRFPTPAARYGPRRGGRLVDCS